LRMIHTTYVHTYVSSTMSRHSSAETKKLHDTSIVHGLQTLRPGLAS